MHHIITISRGENAVQVVERMRAGSHRMEETNEEYMANTATRLGLFEGKEVRADSEHNFIKDLLSFDLIVREGEN